MRLTAEEHLTTHRRQVFRSAKQEAIGYEEVFHLTGRAIRDESYLATATPHLLVDFFIRNP